VDTDIPTAGSSREFYEAGCRQLACAACGSTGAFDIHHVVQRQICRREQIPQHHPDNALRICRDCHHRHSSHQGVLPLSALRDENIAFAVEFLGPGPAYNHFCRYYAGRDTRVDDLLEQP
jgi:hypothetical protein